MPLNELKSEGQMTEGLKGGWTQLRTGAQLGNFERGRRYIHNRKVT